MKENQQQQDDAALVQRLQDRDKRAMEEVLSRHGSRMYAVALQIARNETDAQEVLQDALIQVWQKIASFEGRSAFPTWLHRVTVNAALMKLRKNKRFEQHVPLEDQGPDKDLPILQLADPGEGPDAEVLRGELGGRVQTAIEALPEPYRSTVILSDVEGLTLAEIAEAMEASVPAVKSRLHRGRLALRKVLEPYLQEGKR